jgi:hypothetical protein
MKTRFLFLLLFIASYSFSQSVNDYKAVIVPVKFDFLKSENQYRLNTLTKFNLKKAGFEAFYTNEALPMEYSDRCNVLYLDVKEDNAFLMTKVFITFSDCKGSVVFQSAVGKSKEKDFQLAYTEALNNAFQSVYALNYKYSGAKSNTQPLDVAAPPVAVAPAAVANKSNDINVVTGTAANLLFAQAIPNGFQLVDNTPKVVMKIFRTSNAACYIATKGSIEGVLIAKENHWYFEYYQNDKLFSERIEVKF